MVEWFERVSSSSGLRNRGSPRLVYVLYIVLRSSLLFLVLVCGPPVKPHFFPKKQNKKFPTPFGLKPVTLSFFNDDLRKFVCILSKYNTIFIQIHNSTILLYFSSMGLTSVFWITRVYRREQQTFQQTSRHVSEKKEYPD